MTKTISSSYLAPWYCTIGNRRDQATVNYYAMYETTRCALQTKFANKCQIVVKCQSSEGHHLCVSKLHTVVYETVLLAMSYMTSIGVSDSRHYALVLVYDSLTDDTKWWHTTANTNK